MAIIATDDITLPHNSQIRNNWPTTKKRPVLLCHLKTLLAFSLIDFLHVVGVDIGTRYSEERRVWAAKRIVGE